MRSFTENIPCKRCIIKTTSCSVMPSKIYSAAVVGVEAFEVEIEVHAEWGNTDKIAVVGLPDTAVKKSKDRVTSAISNSAFRWPYGKRITINLAPAGAIHERVARGRISRTGPGFRGGQGSAACQTRRRSGRRRRAQHSHL